MRYHISKSGNPAQCKAVKKECPLGIDSPHFDTKEQAKEYIEKAEFELNETFSKLSKKSSKVISEYTHDEKFKTFGVGKFRKLTTPNGKDWDESLNVEYRKCENFPEQYFDDDKWGDKLTDHEEVAVNGEIIGYIALKTPRSGTADYKVYVFETLEQANDPNARIINATYGTRKSTIGDLIKHYQDYVKQSIDVDNPKKYFTNFKRGEVTSKKIDKNTSIIIEENKYTDSSTYRNIFLIKGGKAVGYIKMSDQKFMGLGGEVERQTVRCDVETRNSERRKSYAKELSTIIEKEYDCKLQSGGTFTPLGFAAFGKNKNRTNDQIGMDWEGANVSQMNFIRDWDKLSL